MRIDRRQAMARLGSLSLAAALGLQTACAVSGVPGGRRRAALLVPRSGQFANIGQNMAAASLLAAPEDDAVLEVTVHDSADPRAAAAAPAGADIVLGPLLGSELRQVMSAARSAPIVSFTNDPLFYGTGPFVFGLAPDQSISAIMLYARGQGVRRVAVVASADPAGAGAASVAEAAGRLAGLEVRRPVMVDGVTSSADLFARLTAWGDGSLPDAVLLSGGERVQDAARLLAGSGVQILGTEQWSGQPLASMPFLQGAWFAAPDPAKFGEFARAFERVAGAPADILSGLAYDATLMARILAAQGRLDRDGLLRQAPFPGVVGDFRLLPDGRCIRDMAIFVVDGGGARLVERTGA